MMLPDFERKLLRILCNFSRQQRRMPVWSELERKTGRDQKRLLPALSRLEAEGYIRWEYSPNPQFIKILEAREREEGPAQRATDKAKTGGIPYWAD